MNIDKTVKLAMALIARPSVTPYDYGCQELLIERIEPIGFDVQRLRFDDVDNLWAQRGKHPPLVVFAGHTGVASPGLRARWQADPFSPEIRDGYLYGCGAADMKSSLAAFITAIENYVSRDPQHRGSIGLLITSDKQANRLNSTRKVAQWLNAEGKKIDHCLVGEPSSVTTLGDIVNNGQCGLIDGVATLRGVQGHVAYPDLAKNPIHMMAPALAELVATQWDDAIEDFPPSSFRISAISAGPGADNVIPAQLQLGFHFCYSPAVTDIELRRRLEDILKRHGVDYDLNWHASAKPYLTTKGILLEALCRAIRQELNLQPKLAAARGGSLGPLIASTGAEVIVFGPLKATTHRVNECIALRDLLHLARVYTSVLERLLDATQ